MDESRTLVAIGFDDGIFTVVAETSNPRLATEVAQDVLLRYEFLVNNTQSELRRLSYKTQADRLITMFRAMGIDLRDTADTVEGSTQTALDPTPAAG